ncbi:MAG: DUF3833 family protein [Alphaproteobacteria bacterium]|nr:DUF3833 family protein [Alphaproteobacteria bacterium]
MIGKWLVLLAALVLGGCMPPVETYKGQGPVFSPESYFNGPIKAWGMVQDRTGKVRERFDVAMVGSWEGDTGTLKEEFTYYSDGHKQNRVWTIRKKPEGNYEGTAADVKSVATGVSGGHAMRWRYIMDLPVGGKTYEVAFDDWMFLMNDGVLINRSYIKKFGITVAELTIFMQKQ